MRKKDLELLSKMKRQEKEARPVSKPQAEQPANNTVTFDVWWSGVAKKLNLPAYLKEVVWADFKARGLQRESTDEQFAKALGQFGYKV
jgi:hypothetical protein